MTGVEAIGLVSAILGVTGQIMHLANKAQRNKEKCQDLGEHVQMIKRLFIILQKHMTPDQWMKDLLQNLNATLLDGMYLVQSCQEKRTWSRVFKTQKKAKKFDALSQRISKSLEQFHMANMILILSMNNRRFFEGVLHKLLQHGACELLPEDVKEEIKSSIMRLTNTDNMSSDAQELLEQIKRDITYSRDSGWSGPQRGNKTSSTGDYLTVGILELTKDIMEQLGMHNGALIQRLVHLVQQLDNMIQHPQIYELSLDPNWSRTFQLLQEDLERISKNIVWYNEKEHNKVKRVMLCGPANGSEYAVLRDTYKIEYHIQVLVIALRQLNERN